MITSLLVFVLTPRTQDSGQNDLEIQRLHRLYMTTLGERDFERAESYLVGLKAAMPASRGRFIASLQAGLCLYQKDYSGALTQLRAYIEPKGPGETVSIGGAETIRAWYWFLLVQAGDHVKANLAWAQFEREGYRNSETEVVSPLSSLGGTKLSQLYSALGQVSFRQGYDYRGGLYFSLVRKTNPGSKIASDYSDFEAYSNTDKNKEAEKLEDFPPFDHLEYEKDTKKPAIIQ